MSTPAVGNATINTLTANTVPPLSDGEFEKEIRSIKAEQIEVLAKKIITKMMNRLKIDTAFGVVNGLVNRDIFGHRSSVLRTKFDPESRMIKTLLPIVTKKITEAFSTPNLFLKKGIELDLFTANNSGILDQISDEFLRPRLIEARLKMEDSLELDTALLGITLSVNFARADKELFFDIITYVNGSLMNHAGGTIDQFEADVKQGLI